MDALAGTTDFFKVVQETEINAFRACQHEATSVNHPTVCVTAPISGFGPMTRGSLVRILSPLPESFNDKRRDELLNRDIFYPLVKAKSRLNTCLAIAIS